MAANAAARPVRRPLFTAGKPLPSSGPLIGTSLSRCALSIAKGEVHYDRVKLIISGTRCDSEEDWTYALEEYVSGGKWGRDATEPARIARQLIDEGKVRQPRLQGNRPPDPNTCPIWVTKEKEIIWWPDGLG